MYTGMPSPPTITNPPSVRSEMGQIERPAEGPAAAEQIEPGVAEGCHRMEEGVEGGVAGWCDAAEAPMHPEDQRSGPSTASMKATVRPKTCTMAWDWPIPASC